jgi:ABC-type Fe3+ transport system permease subunit
MRELLDRPGRWSRLAWALVLLPFLAPVLLVGYAYSGLFLALVRLPALKEGLYVLLLCVRLAPVAALVMHFAPAPLSPQAVHCRRLLRAGERGWRRSASYLAFLARGPARGWAAAFVVVFLLAFAEFEAASLLGVRTWSVWLFDAQAGGLATSEALRAALLPTACQAGLVTAVLLVLVGARGGRPAQEGRASRGTSWRRAGWAWAGLAAAAGAAVPAAVAAGGAAAGIGPALRSFALGGDIGASLIFASAGAVAAHVLAGWIAEAPIGGGGSRRLGLAVGFSLPGLLGPLMVALLLVFAFQWIGWSALYDTPVPLVLGLCLVLLPFAVLLRLVLHSLRPAQALHAADLLGASAAPSARAWRRRLRWQMLGRSRFWVLALLFYWAYFDLTASAILAPPGMTPVTVRLYNLMHYGRTAVLSAMVMISFAMPVVLAAAAGLGHGRLLRWVCHV